MNTATRAVLLATFASVGLLPVLTGHALLEEILRLHAGGPASAWEHPDFVLLLLLTTAAFVPLVRMARTVHRSFAASRRLRAVVAVGSRRTFLGIEYVRVPGGDVTLCTAGFFRPTIYVSEGAESALAPGQFRAALLHERAHASGHDVRWLALMAALDRALAFVPWTARVFALLRLLIERHADESALAAGARRADLFDAIVVASAPALAGAALSEVGVLQRLRWLAEPQQKHIGETRTAAVLLATLMTPPAMAHLLLWTGILCAICSTHVG